jgi:hypothetical protein
MPTNEEWRKALGRDDLSDEDVAAFADGIRAIVAQILDEYFRDEFEPDGV